MSCFCYIFVLCNEHMMYKWVQRCHKTWCQIIYKNNGLKVSFTIFTDKIVCLKSSIFIYNYVWILHKRVKNVQQTRLNSRRILGSGSKVGGWLWTSQKRTALVSPLLAFNPSPAPSRVGKHVSVFWDSRKHVNVTWTHVPSWGIAFKNVFLEYVTSVGERGPWNLHAVFFAQVPKASGHCCCVGHALSPKILGNCMNLQDFRNRLQHFPTLPQQIAVDKLFLPQMEQWSEHQTFGFFWRVDIFKFQRR